MMGPLSVKAQVQANAGRVKDQMTVIKTLSDEARKKDLHKLKMAKEIAKAKAEGIPIDESAIGFADGKLAIPRPGSKQPDTTIKGNNKGTNQPTKTLGIPPVSHAGVPPVTLQNPEAGPSDTIPAMLTPGEAVIPASVAQDSTFKPVIEALVNEGRVRNRQPGGVKGFADGGYAYSDSFEALSDPSFLQPVPDTIGNTDPGFLKSSGMSKEQWEAWLEKQRKQESGGKHRNADGSLVTSSKGAQGIAQIMPATAKDPGFGIAPLKDDSPEEAKRFQNDYMKMMMERYKDPEKALAAYNAGPGVVDKLILKQGDAWKNGLPKETSDYISKIGTPDVATVNQGTPAENESAAETRRLAAHPVPPPPTDIRAQAEFANRWSQPVTVHGNPQVDEEIKTLKRYIENPSTPANERGKARLRLAELERKFNDQSTMPALGRNYSGTAKPAGSSAIPGQSVSTAPARFEENRIAADAAPAVPPVPPVPRIAPAEKTTPAVPPIQGEPGGTGIRLKKQADQLESTLQDPAVTRALETLQKTPPPTGEDPKNWLEKGLAKIFGKTGLFNEEDLIRFSLLAAGGLLTGGSVGGSLRYAGLATLKSSDDRRAGQAAATARQVELDRQSAARQAEIDRQSQVEAAKNIRERIEGKEKQYHELIKDATPEAKAQAGKYLAEYDKADTVGAREAAITNALRVLSAQQADKGGKKDGNIEYGMDANSGKPVRYINTGDNRLLVEVEPGKFAPMTDTKINPMPTSQYNAINEAQLKKSEAAIEGVLSSAFTREDGSRSNKMTDSMIKMKAGQYAAQMHGLQKYFGYNMSPEKHSALLSSVLSNFKEQIRSGEFDQLSTEAMPKLVLGAASMNQLVTTGSKNFKAKTETGRPSMEASILWGGVIEKAVNEGYDKDKVISDLQEKFDREVTKDPQRKKAYDALAEANPGYSPFLLWVREPKYKLR